MQRIAGCDASMRGVECALNADLYLAVTSVVWILTALPLLAWLDWAVPAAPDLERSASKTACASLLFVAASALYCFVDSVLASTTVGFVHQALCTVGSLCLVAGICDVWATWCDVASALSGLHAGDQGWGRLMIRACLTKWMPLLHFPFAVMFCVHDLRVFVSQEAFDIIVIVWGAWLVFGTLFVLSRLAYVQCYIARVCLASVDGARSLQETALVNLIQQFFIDLLIVIYAALSAAHRKPDGGIIAAYHALGFLAFWAKLVQMVLFFAVLGNTDPMYNQSEFDQLLSKVDDSTDDVPAITLGSPGTSDDDAVYSTDDVPASTVGSPSTSDDDAA